MKSVVIRKSTRGSVRSAVLWATAGIGALSCQAPVEQQLEAGQRALARGQYSEAIERYTEVVLQFPGSDQAAKALYDLGVIYYFERRNLDAARDSFRKILLEYPERPVAHDARIMLARMYYEDLDEPAKAMEEYLLLLEEAVDEREERDILFSLAECRFQQGDLMGAAGEYRRVIEDLSYDEESDRAFLRLAHTEMLMGQWEEAVGTLNRLLVATDDPRSRHEAFLARLELLLRFEPRRARASLESADREFPDDPFLMDLGARLASVEWEAKSLEDGGAESQSVLQELQRNISWGRGPRTRRAPR